MTREISMHPGDMVARSLSITRTTHALVAVVTAAVTLNAMVAMQFIGLLGQAVLLSLVFVTLAAGLSAVSLEVYSRSGQAVSNLRSIGATSGSLSKAVLVSIIGYGAAGSALGAAAGAGLGAALGGPSVAGVTALAEGVGVIVAASAATAAGVYLGARAAWRS